MLLPTWPAACLWEARAWPPPRVRLGWTSCRTHAPSHLFLPLCFSPRTGSAPSRTSPGGHRLWRPGHGLRLQGALLRTCRSVSWGTPPGWVRAEPFASSVSPGHSHVQRPRLTRAQPFLQGSSHSSPQFWTSSGPPTSGGAGAAIKQRLAL